LTETVLVLGAAGQLGRELQRTAGDSVTCVAVGREQLDIANGEALDERLTSLRPDQVINAAAYTAVDRAESEPELARRVNAEGPALLAAACERHGARLLHVSTDFVFDGRASTPYTPDAATAPLGEYGRSKLAGERAVRERLGNSVILRTGWVYSAFGGNFVKTMLRLMGERDELAVVDDQVGTPTWARGLAEACWALVARPGLRGTYHWSDAGVCSWYDFAVAIAEEGSSAGLVTDEVRVRPIPGIDYPTPARRPAYSVLDKSATRQDLSLPAIHWRVQLRAMLAELAETPDA
jgi:dTDP-4-dehydrorhamnose reductase